MVVRYYSSVATPTTLTGGVNNSTTTITVAAVTGFPTLFPYTLSLDFDNALAELVDVTAASGTTLTVTRGVDGTSATSHSAGATVRHVASARDYADSRAHENATTNVHGASGEIVGETGVQSLEDKTLVSPIITNNVDTEVPLTVQPIGTSTATVMNVNNAAGTGVLAVLNTGALIVGGFSVFGTIQGGPLSGGAWQDIPLEAGYVTSQGFTPEYRLQQMAGSTWVELRGSIQPSSGSFPSGFTTVATLPTAGRPEQPANLAVGTNTGQYAGVRILTDGRIQVQGNNGIGSINAVYLSGIRLTVE